MDKLTKQHWDMAYYEAGHACAYFEYDLGSFQSVKVMPDKADGYSGCIYGGFKYLND
jgi:hypothetical protein